MCRFTKWEMLRNLPVKWIKGLKPFRKINSGHHQLIWAGSLVSNKGFRPVFSVWIDHAKWGWPYSQSVLTIVWGYVVDIEWSPDSSAWFDGPNGKSGQCHGGNIFMPPQLKEFDKWLPAMGNDFRLKFLFQVEWQPMKCFPGLRLNSWQNHEKRILAAIDDFIWILIQLLVLSKCVKQPLKYGLAWWTTRPLFGIEAEINGMGWDGMEWYVYLTCKAEFIMSHQNLPKRLSFYYHWIMTRKSLKLRYKRLSAMSLSIY